MKILIVEDEPKVASFIELGLKMNGIQSEIANDGDKGLKLSLTEKFDAIILDVNLPRINGLEVCRLIRQQNKKLPILILTAFSTTAEKLSGFNMGADDYLVKPFEFEELLARVKSLLRRSQNEDSSENIFEIADMQMDLDAKTVKRNNKLIELTAKEFLLLEYMLKNKGRVLSRADISEKIWDLDFDTGTNIIDLYIHYLRSKIDKNFHPKLIHTVVGMGYVLKIKDE